MSDDITGRDHLLIVQALFYAAHFIAGLPEIERPRSNRDDMIKLLRARLGDAFIIEAEEHGVFLERATGRPRDVGEY